MGDQCRETQLSNKNILDDLEPEDAVMKVMWYGAIGWALGDKEVLEQFRKDTGNKYRPPRSPIEKMVDEATGADKHFLREFAKWVNKNIWGDEPDTTR